MSIMSCEKITCNECDSEIDCENVVMCPYGHRDDLLFCSDACLQHHIRKNHS